MGRAKLGDAAAFEMLLRRHFRGAYLVAMAQLGEPSDAEDACQDAFVKCWERIRDCREPARFASWLLRIVRNVAHNHREYLEVRTGSSLDFGDTAAAPSTPETDLERRELGRTLWRALSQLQPMQREVVLLHDLEGWRHADVARMLEISETMSRRHVSDARKILRGLLRGTGYLEEAND